MKTAYGWIRAMLLVAGLVLSAVATAHDVPEEDVSKQGWAGSVNLGASLSTGTSDLYALNGGAALKRSWTDDSLGFTLKGLYGQSDGDVTANNQSLAGLYRHDFTGRWYAYLNSEVGRDTIQFIDWRYLMNGGPGFRVWDGGDKHHLDLEAGIGYRHTVFRNDPTTDDADIRAALIYGDWFGKVLETLLSLEYLLPANRTYDYLIRARAVISVPMTGTISFRTAFDLEYDNLPAEGASGLNTVTAIGLEYSF
ncbi:MAG: DUF481 domain-containing protein [Proteobacteria bacterium]|nr:DUF481 domain-containing protein [Pseudomonadota bacterium]